MKNVLKTAAILLFLPCLAFAYDIYVSPNGSDINTGTKDRPTASIERALERAQKLIELRGYPAEGINIIIEPGEYSFAETLAFGDSLSGLPEHPLTIKCVDGKAFFNGGIALDTAGGKIAENEPVLSPRARGNVYAVEINDGRLVSLLSNRSVRLSQQGRMMTLAKYPNIGYAHIKEVIDEGAVYAHGRTKGDPPKYSMDEPIGGVFTVRNKDVSAWEKEFEKFKKAYVVGYLSNDWYKETHTIASISDGRIKLVDYSRYGLGVKKEIPRRFIVNDLLSELDSPGEFFFDENANKLYFWPFNEGSISGLSIWGSKSFAEFKKASNVRLENIVIEGVSQGRSVVNITDSENVELAGCVIRNCSRPAVIIEGGSHCGIRSCDIYDVPHHLTLSGGNVKELKPSGHYAVNNHFTQVQASDYYGRIQIRGVGQVFSSNLVHNFIGQVMTVGDNDHRIEYNEFFNIGIEEGDGGTIYSGAAMWSWGNVYQHNFLHHLMCLPQAHPRGGIYPDDRDQGDTIKQNVFYKAAHRAVLINGGAGHNVNDNIFLEGYIGIYNTEANSEEMYDQQAQYDSGELKRGDKTDYIWRTEQVVGKRGWNKEPWKSKYPLFAKIMNQPKMRFWPIECDFSGNYFHGNAENIQYRFGYGRNDTKDISEVEYIEARNNREISLDIFKDADSLDFSYAAQRIAQRMPDIRFDRIGLYQDQYRKNVPDKKLYRKLLADKFRDRKSYDPGAQYDPDTISDMIYFNTGKLIMAQTQVEAQQQNNYSIRDGLPNLYSKLEAGEDITIAYFGGSITAQDGYRVQTFKWFQESWPDCEFTQVNAAIGGTGSELGAFRLYDDVLSHKPDLVFVEFAVNDYTLSLNDSRAVEASMEGIIRQIIKNDPQTDICLIYTITYKMIDAMKEGQSLPSLVAHEKIASHYGLPSINVGFVVAELEKQGKLVMKGDQGQMQAVSGDSLNETVEVSVNEKGQIVFSKDGVHPYPNSGHRIYTQHITDTLPLMQTSSGPRPRKLKSAVNEDNLERAKMVPLSEVKLKGSWKKYDSEEGLISGWILEKMPDMMVAQKAGDSIEFKFEGTMAGFYDIMGPAVGVIECDIDGKKIYASRFDKYCTYYRIGSRTYDTPQGEHKVSFTLTDRDIDKAAVLSERGSSIDDPARYSGKNWYVGKIMLIGDLITE